MSHLRTSQLLTPAVTPTRSSNSHFLAQSRRASPPSHRRLRVRDWTDFQTFWWIWTNQNSWERRVRRRLTPGVIIQGKLRPASTPTDPPSRIYPCIMVMLRAGPTKHLWLSPSIGASPQDWPKTHFFIMPMMGCRTRQQLRGIYHLCLHSPGSEYIIFCFFTI